MIKGTGQTGDGRPLLVLGLTGENITRLMADEPILINLADMDLPDTQIIIIAGKTDEDIAKKLTKHGLLDTHCEVRVTTQKRKGKTSE